MGVLAPSAVDRVYWSLLGQADPSGFVAKFMREETLDYAQVKASEFESALAELERTGRVQVEKTGRVRRFSVRFAPSDRARANAFIAERRDLVRQLASERVRLSDRRGLMVPHEAPATVPEPRIVKVEPLPSSAGERWSFTVIIPGIGTIAECVYVRLPDKAFVAGYAAYRNREREPIVRFTAAFASRLQSMIESMDLPVPPPV
jgi:hypothetical protein